MIFTSFKTSYDLRLGVPVFDFIGQYPIANKKPNVGIRAPSVLTDHLTARQEVKKVFLHPDQVFYRGLSENPWPLLRFCEGYTGLYNHVPEICIVATSEDNLLVLECGSTVELVSIRHSGVDKGKVEICLGDRLNEKIPRIAMVTPESELEVFNPYEKKGSSGKIITIQLWEGASLPYMEFICSKPVSAMPDKIIQGRQQTIGQVLSVRYPLIFRKKDASHLDKLVFDNAVQDIEVDKCLYPTGFRFQPMFDQQEGWDVFMDDILHWFKNDKQNTTIRICGFPETTKGNPKAIAVIVSRIIARYGNSKSLPHEKTQVDKTEFQMEDTRAKLTRNVSRTGLGYVQNVWVDGIEIPEKAEDFCELAKTIYDGARFGDATARVVSLPFVPDRNFLYMAIRMGNAKYGRFPWDIFCLELSHINQVPEIYRCILLLNSYATSVPIWVKLTLKVKSWQWPAFAHLFLLWNADRVVVMNWTDMFKQGANVLQPEPEWYEMADWYHNVKEKDITKVQFSNDVVRVIYRQPATEDRLDYLFLGPNPEGKPFVLGKELRLPRVKTLRAVIPTEHMKEVKKQSRLGGRG